jgi:hypothetical protein
MKKTVFFLMALGVVFSAQAQQIPEYRIGDGTWVLNRVDGRLYQNDEEAGLAKANFLVPQSGPMLYEFNVRYEGRTDDTHAGFGIHLFVDEALNAPSWGSGQSWLLWLNYDENPVSADIPAGLSAQVYRSDSQAEMELVNSVDLNEYAYLLTPENLAVKVPVKLYMDPVDGEIRAYDPIDADYYYYFYIDPASVKNGSNWVTLRTNSMKASFGLGL